MVFEEAGTYTIEYTATDECGNTTNAERTVIVEAPPTYRTVLYTDGTFIINESSRDEAANVQAHGQPTNVYDPFDPNGDTDVKKYIFSNQNARQWDTQKTSIISVEFGSLIKPTNMNYWFYGCDHMTSFDGTNLDTSNVTSMELTFYGCSSLTTLDLSGFVTTAVTRMKSMFYGCQLLSALNISTFDTSSVTNMSSMFNNCRALTSLDVSNFNTNSVTNMSEMFSNCRSLTSLDLTSFNTSIVTTMLDMFNYCNSLITLDLSSFNTSSVTSMYEMFVACSSLKTIYASANFIVTQVTSSSRMFYSMSTNLVGGAGTVWNSSYVDKTRAKIDGGVGDEGYFTAKN